MRYGAGGADVPSTARALNVIVVSHCFVAFRADGHVQIYSEVGPGGPHYVNHAIQCMTALLSGMLDTAKVVEVAPLVHARMSLRL